MFDTKINKKEDADGPFLNKSTFRATVSCTDDSACCQQPSEGLSQQLLLSE